MSLLNLLLAVDALLALTDAAQRVAATIADARSEGRDITDAELEESRATMRRALERLAQTKGRPEGRLEE